MADYINVFKPPAKRTNLTEFDRDVLTIVKQLEKLSDQVTDAHGTVLSMYGLVRKHGMNALLAVLTPEQHEAMVGMLTAFDVMLQATSELRVPEFPAEPDPEPQPEPEQV